MNVQSKRFTRPGSISLQTCMLHVHLRIELSMCLIQAN